MPCKNRPVENGTKAEGPGAICRESRPRAVEPWTAGAAELQRSLAGCETERRQTAPCPAAGYEPCLPIGTPARGKLTKSDPVDADWSLPPIPVTTRAVPR